MSGCVSSELIELTVTALGSQGDGVARHEGTPLFVPYTLAGDRVRARRAGPERALPLEWLERGPGHAIPPCPHFGPGKCGGCALQHLEDELYARWKVESLAATLERAGLRGFAMQPLARTPPGSRRRAEFLVRAAGGAVTLGFHVRASHEAVDIGPCPVLAPAIERLLAPLRQFFAMLWPRTAFDVLATSVGSGVELVLTRAPQADRQARSALAGFAEQQDLSRIALRPGPHAAAEIVVQRRPSQTAFGGVTVDLPPGGFLQASLEGELAIQQAVLEGIGRARRVADLYAGSGSIALPVAATGRQVFAADRSAEAIAALDAGARRGGLGPRVKAEARDLNRRPPAGDELDAFDAVIFDPPREGAAEQARALARSRVKRVVAVSCNPATFARDASTLIAGGYALRTVTPVDQFLWSAHLELVGVFER
jgi:23S rRNA (uracil1939-C5)-methyltransferase